MFKMKSYEVKIKEWDPYTKRWEFFCTETVEVSSVAFARSRALTNARRANPGRTLKAGLPKRIG